eukprot:1354717-Alexandrium_andersonii.AAC.1
MSASLVGSEMCIRDRCHQGQLDSTRAQTGHASVLGALQAAWAAIGPVSYTHLTLPTICSV